MSVLCSRLQVVVEYRIVGSGAEVEKTLIWELWASGEFPYDLRNTPVGDNHTIVPLPLAGRY